MWRPGSTLAREPPLWLARLRWRLRGESARLAFVLAVLAQAALLAVLPVKGDGGVSWTTIAQLVALDLVLAVVGGALGARSLRRRDPSLPRIVARDRAATFTLVAGVVAVLVGGIVHRPALTAEREKVERMVAEAKRVAERRAPEYTKARLRSYDARRLAPSVLRVCFPTRSPDRAWCTVVRPDRGGYRARRDEDTRPNDQAGGTAGPPRPMVRRTP
jgi:hypothetical protein